jgi:6-phosphogluconolactonase/glucosamine-6-phosphate isomerase/deaminase
VDVTKIMCYSCGKNDHFASTCPNKSANMKKGHSEVHVASGVRHLSETRISMASLGVIRSLFNVELS